MTTIRKKHSFDEVFDAQKVFRLLLTAMSNPTRVVYIKKFADKLFGASPQLLALAFTLLDNEVSFVVCGCQTLAEDISILTLSEKVSAEQADYLFVTDPSLLETAIAAAKCGTPEDPHESATVIIKDGGAACHKIKLSGPGIDGTAELLATETVNNALDLRDIQGYEYPQGIDLIIVSENGEMFAVPRLVKKEVG